MRWFIRVDAAFNPTPTIFDTDPDAYKLYREHGRLHAGMFDNRGTADVSDLRVWSPPLGDAQSIDSAYPVNGLPATGAGIIQVPNVDTWHPNTRFILVQRLSGTEELVGGYLDGNNFVVPATGRGLASTSIEAGQAFDVVYPVSGLRLGWDGGVGIAPRPTYIVDFFNSAQTYFGSVAPHEEIYLDGTPSPVTADGSLHLPTVYQRLPAIAPAQRWEFALDENDSVRLVQPLPADYRAALWMHLVAFPGMRYTPLMPVTLAWRYTIGGVTYRQEARTYIRVANDLSAERYRAYRGIGDGTPVDDTAAVASAAARPFDVPVIAGEINNIEVRKTNDYGVEGILGAISLDVPDDGGAGVSPLSVPELTLQQVASAGQPAGEAFCVYIAALDTEPADTWVIDVDGTETTYSMVGGQDIEQLLHTFNADAGTVTVTLKVRRSSDSVESVAVVKTIDLVSIALDSDFSVEVFQTDQRLTNITD